MRAPSVPLLALLVALLLVPAALGGDAPLFPTSPPALAAAAALLVVGWIVVVAPTTRGGAPSVVAACALVAAPALAAIARAAGPLVVPWAFLAVGGAAGLLAAAVRVPWRARVVSAAAVVLFGGAALEAAGVVALPAALRAPTSPLLERAADDGMATVLPAAMIPSAWRTASPGAFRRVGRFARTPAAATFPAGVPPAAAGRWMAVGEGVATDLPRAGPVVRVAGVADAPAVEGASHVVAGPLAVEDPRDLDPFDVVVLGAIDDDPRTADALVGFVRRGGLLVGGATTRPWPPALARRLGRDAPDVAGPGGVRGLGAGHVARASDPHELAAVLAAGAAVPRLATVFDHAVEAPPAPAFAPRWSGEASAARALLRLALAVTVVLGIAASLVRRRLPILGLLALVGGAQVLWLPAPRDEPAVTSIALETAGAGGRRIETLHVAAGPRGWVGPATGEGVGRADAVRTLGFRTLRSEAGLHLALAPWGTGWIVVDREAPGDTTGLEEVEGPPVWATALLERVGHGALTGRVAAGVVSGAALAWPGLPTPRTTRVVILRPR